MICVHLSIHTRETCGVSPSILFRARPSGGTPPRPPSPPPHFSAAPPHTAPALSGPSPSILPSILHAVPVYSTLSAVWCPRQRISLSIVLVLCLRPCVVRPRLPRYTDSGAPPPEVCIHGPPFSILPCSRWLIVLEGTNCGSERESAESCANHRVSGGHAHLEAS
jgi:hypothetical protein